MKILVIEDESDLLKTIEDFLIREGYLCETAENFGKAQAKLSIYEYDIVLLDIGLPDGNGLELLETVRKFQDQSGVIIISAKNSLDDKIAGLDLGADDYMTKPFQLSELNSRIKALLRRRHFGGDNILAFNEIEINVDRKSVHIHGIEVVFTKKEYDLLLYFLVNKNRVLTKETIADHLWNDDIYLANSLDFVYTHLNNIRKKIKKAGGNDYIKTIYGMGYKFTDQ